jgi:hypothetical protein
MKRYILITISMLTCSISFGQIELSTGYAANKRMADGAPIHIAYDIKLNNKLYTKFQIGYKHLYHFNDFVNVKLRTSIIELHQTISYELVKTKRYILKPNLGLNYRFYKWKSEMEPPLDAYPYRRYVIWFRNNETLGVISTNTLYKDEYKVSNLGFTIQLQSQFKLNDNAWMHITPFLEPDYDRVQNTGGCYVGLIFKNLTSKKSLKNQAVKVPN